MTKNISIFICTIYDSLVLTQSSSLTTHPWPPSPGFFLLQANLQDRNLLFRTQACWADTRNKGFSAGERTGCGGRDRATLPFWSWQTGRGTSPGGLQKVQRSRWWSTLPSAHAQDSGRTGRLWCPSQHPVLGGLSWIRWTWEYSRSSSSKCSTSFIRWFFSLFLGQGHLSLVWG